MAQSQVPKRKSLWIRFVQVIVRIDVVFTNLDGNVESFRIIAQLRKFEEMKLIFNINS